MKSSRSILLLGGARSGKSRAAAQMALKATARPVYLATSRRWDDEHAARIERHQADRGPEWITIEEPLNLSRVTADHPVIVVDCVTLWLSNVFESTEYDLDQALAIAREQIDSCLAQHKTWLWVSNEIGQGVHASTPTARRFVDLQGFTNQYLAARVDTVALLVAGIPLTVKGTLL
jgi:adenosylcobinamide kinase / adenosylcobinamide-phosphate guanylyltransferase